MPASIDPSGGGAPEPPPDPNLIFILNLLLLGGAGYWLLGQRLKAVVATILWIAGLWTCGVVSGLVSLAAAMDGYREARTRIATRE